MIRMEINRNGLIKLIPFFEDVIKEHIGVEGPRVHVGYDGLLRSDSRIEDLVDILGENYDIDLVYLGQDRYGEYVFEVITEVEDEPINEQQFQMNPSEYSQALSGIFQDPRFKQNMQDVVRQAIEANSQQQDSASNVTDRDPTTKGVNPNSPDVQKDLEKIEQGVTTATQEIEKGVDQITNMQKQQADAFEKAREQQSKSVGQTGATEPSVDVK